MKEMKDRILNLFNSLKLPPDVKSVQRLLLLEKELGSKEALFYFLGSRRHMDFMTAEGRLSEKEKDDIALEWTLKKFPPRVKSD